MVPDYARNNSRHSVSERASRTVRASITSFVMLAYARFVRIWIGLKGQCAKPSSTAYCEPCESSEQAMPPVHEQITPPAFDQAILRAFDQAIPPAFDQAMPPDFDKAIPLPSSLRPGSPPVDGMPVDRMPVDGIGNFELQCDTPITSAELHDAGAPKVYSFDECVVCLEGAPMYCFMPCRHFCICETCFHTVIMSKSMPCYICCKPANLVPGL